MKNRRGATPNKKPIVSIYLDNNRCPIHVWAANYNIINQPLKFF